MNEKKDMKTCIRPCVLMINECDKRYIIFKIFFTLIQGLLPATFIIIMQKIINLIQKKADVREILLYTCMYLVLLLLENINGNIEEFYTSKFSLKFNNSINLQILEKSTKLELVDYENPETYDFINRAKSQNGSSILAYVGDALDVVKQFVMLGSTIAILINLKWWIVVVVLIFPLIRSLITYAIDKKWFDIRIKRTKKERKIWYINYLLTAGNAFKEIKLYGVAANLIGKFKKMTGEIIEQDKKMLKNIFFISLGYDLLELCFSGIILFYTINLGITGAILIGDVTAYIDSVEKVKESAKGIFTGINNLFEETLYLNLLFEFLNKKINDDIKGRSSSNQGSFEKLLSNIKMIKEEYPEYFSKKVSFNTVLNPERSYSCVSDYISGEELLKNNVFMSSLINTHNSKKRTQVSERFMEELRYEEFLLLLSKIEQYPKEKLSPLSRPRGMELDSLRFEKNLIGRERIPQKAHHGGPCVPGNYRIFVDVDGNFYPCERVSETSEEMKIGNLKEGIDKKQVIKIMNIEKLTEKECHNCWAYDYCNVCAANLDTSTSDPKRALLEECKSIRKSVEDKFKDYCVLKMYDYQR